MSINAPTVDTGVIIRRSLYFIVLILLTLANLFVLFRGLNSPQAMDQAQMGREISRGHGFTTKFVRPAAYSQAQTAKGTDAISFKAFEDTYHSPLNPLLMAAVFKVIGADDAEKWQMSERELIFPLDRVVATICVVCFLLAIGVNYLLINRIFDAKIAGVCAILMLFCGTFWQYALSGLPQMLMLLLFSCALYFVYRAAEAASEGRMALAPAVVAGVFFTLLALSHWLTVWIALGYIIFAAVALRPRGAVALTVVALLIVASILPIMRAVTISGSVFGTAFLTLYNGLGGGGDQIMRSYDFGADGIDLTGLFSKITSTTLAQLSDIVPFLGGLIVAPLFFVSLLHSFKRKSIANFRWAVLLMWVFAAIGLAFFGVSAQGIDPNQIHLLFAPIMAAYGIAFISVLWSRLEFVAATPGLKNVHLITVVLISILPLALTLPREFMYGMARREAGGMPHWPPYFAPRLNLAISQWVSEDQIVVSDQPWAVAWYADRISIWLPNSIKDFEALQSRASDLRTPITGILISPVSHESGSIREVNRNYGDFTSLVLDGRVYQITATNRDNGVSTLTADRRLEGIAKQFSFRQPLVETGMIFYSNRALKTEEN